MAYVRIPNKRLFHLVVKLKNKPGALAGAASILARAPVNVLGSFTAIPDGGTNGIWSLFAESKNKVATGDSLRKRLLASPYVADAEVREDKGGFLTDLCFPIVLSEGGRAVLMRQKYFTQMLDNVRETFGSGGDSIIYREGFDYGKSTWENVVATLGRDYVLENLNDVLSLYTSLGWGRTECVELDLRQPRIRIRMDANFECVDHQSDRPNSEFVRGHLCGALSAILDTEVECNEVMCVSKGDRHCEFVVNRVISRVDNPTARPPYPGFPKKAPATRRK